MADHDLAALWDAHCSCEFETRDVDATMATMVAEPLGRRIEFASAQAPQSGPVMPGVHRTIRRQ
jgi:hypothetical protein